MTSTTPSGNPRRNVNRHFDLERLTVVATRDHVACELDGEAVILHLGKGEYYGLNAVGARVWTLIQSPATAAAVRDALLMEYDVERSVCEKELMDLLEGLSKRGLIELTREPVEGGLPPADPPSDQPA